MMKVKIFEFNPICENTYLLFDETNECVIVDAGCFYDAEKNTLLRFIQDNKLSPKLLLNTHLHFDHVLGNNFVFEQFGLKTKANAGDEFLLTALPAQMRMFGFKDTEAAPTIGAYLNENDIIEFGNQKLQVLETPGHSPGSLCFYNAQAGCVLVGDVLFQSSIGRTDLAGGNYNELIESIKQKLLILPPNTIVYSGHGPSTTIQEEMHSNVYLQ